MSNTTNINISSSLLCVHSLPYYESLDTAKKQFMLYGLDLDTNTSDVKHVCEEILNSIGKVAEEPSFDNLCFLAHVLANLFLLRGKASFIDCYEDEQIAYWSITNGPIGEWFTTVCNDKCTTFSIYVDKSDERIAYVDSKRSLLGWYLMPSFINLSKLYNLFIDTPVTITYHEARRKRNPENIHTLSSHVVAFEDSPFLYQVKEKLLYALTDLPDPGDKFVSMFNRIINNAIYPLIENSTCRDYKSITSSIINEFSNTLLVLPISRFSKNDRPAVWTPWLYSFKDFNRVATKKNCSVYVSSFNQVQWRSDYHQQCVAWSLISKVIPEIYQPQVGVIRGWRNSYLDNEQLHLSMMKNIGKRTNGR